MRKQTIERYKATDVRWLCYPDTAVTANCIKGLCSMCSKPPLRRKVTYKAMKEWAAANDLGPADVSQGMLFRPVTNKKR